MSLQEVREGGGGRALNTQSPSFRNLTYNVGSAGKPISLPSLEAPLEVCGAGRWDCGERRDRRRRKHWRILAQVMCTFLSK